MEETSKMDELQAVFIPTKNKYRLKFLYGGLYGIRTCDKWIKSPLLYQLS